MRSFCLALLLFIGLATHAYAQQSPSRTVPPTQEYGTIQQYSSAGGVLLPIIASYGAAGLGLAPLVGNIVVLARQRQFKTTTMAWGITGTVWGATGLILSIAMIAAFPEASSLSALITLPAMSMHAANIVLGAINIHRARRHPAPRAYSLATPGSQGTAMMRPGFAASFQLAIP